MGGWDGGCMTCGGCIHLGFVGLLGGHDKVGDGSQVAGSYHGVIWVMWRSWGGHIGVIWRSYWGHMGSRCSGGAPPCHEAGRAHGDCRAVQALRNEYLLVQGLAVRGGGEATQVLHQCVQRPGPCDYVPHTSTYALSTFELHYMAHLIDDWGSCEAA